jgi:hypothetical protein
MSEVTSVNTKTGAVVLKAADVEAIPASEAGQPGGVATLNGSGELPEAQLPGSVASKSEVSTEEARAKAAEKTAREEAEGNSDPKGAATTAKGEAEAAATGKAKAAEEAAIAAATAKVKAEEEARTAAVKTETERAEAAEALKIPLAQKGKASGVAELNGEGKLPEGELPGSVDTSGTRNYVDAVHDYKADPTGATFSTTPLKEAWEAAKAKKWALFIPLGVYKVSTVAGAIFVQGAGEATPIIGLGCGTEGSSLTRSATSIVRAEGSLPIWTCIGTGPETTERGHPVAKDIEFNGLSTVGDLVVFARTIDPCLDNVRFNNVKGRALRNQQSFNGTWGKCYFTNSGSTASRFTGCSWESGKNKVVVKGTVPPNGDNLLCYGHGIPFGTVVKEAKEIKTGEWEVILSANTTDASTATGAFTIEGAPALSIEGYSGLGSVGSSAVNHFGSCEFEGNAGVDIDLAGSADGQSAPASITTIVSGKQERQIETNHEPVIRERYALGTVISAFPMNPGGCVTSAVGTIAGGELNKLKLTAKNALVKAGQQVTGLGSPKYVNLKANGVTSNKTLAIQGRVPLNGLGSVSTEGTTFAGVSTGMRVRSPGSSAITPGTTVTAVTATTIELSAEPTEEMAGVEIVIGGIFVESVENEETVTLDTNAIGAHAGQTYVFGGSRTKHVSKPSYGYSAGELILNAIRMAHSGAPDIYINQDSGKIVEGSMVFTSDGAIPPGLAYHRIDSAVSADSFKLPTRGANSQYPLQLITDERTSAPSSAAYEQRELDILGFTANGEVKQPVLIGHTLAYEMPKAGKHVSIIYASFVVPDDIAPNAWIYVDFNWMTSETSKRAYFQLLAHASSSINLETAAYEVQASLAALSRTEAGKPTTTTVSTKKEIDGVLLTPGTVVHLQIAREAANGEDTLESTLYLTDASIHYQRA